jgi:hypothetical protein
MPSYSNSAFKKPPILLTPGVPEYLFGSWSMDVSPTKMIVSKVQRTSTTATITVQIIAGPIPVVGDFISVVGTTTDAGSYNNTHVAISAVSIVASTGAGTIAYTSSGTAASTTADSGLAETLIAEVGEAIANGSSIPVCLAYNTPNMNNERTVVLAVSNTASSLTGTIVAQLEQALRDEDSEYVLIGTTISVPTTAATNLQSYTLAGGRYYRLNISGVTGGSGGTIVAKIMG